MNSTWQFPSPKCRLAPKGSAGAFRPPSLLKTQSLIRRLLRFTWHLVVVNSNSTPIGKRKFRIRAGASFDFKFHIISMAVFARHGNWKIWVTLLRWRASFNSIKRSRPTSLKMPEPIKSFITKSTAVCFVCKEDRVLACNVVPLLRLFLDNGFHPVKR